MLAAALGIAGTLLMGVAVYNERRMQRHRQPGVSYSQVTFRRDGGWKRSDLFTDAGLRYQRRASGFGVPAALLWVLALLFLAFGK
jgi:hypothetical protein